MKEANINKIKFIKSIVLAINHELEHINQAKILENNEFEDEIEKILLESWFNINNSKLVG